MKRPPFRVKRKDEAFFFERDLPEIEPVWPIARADVDHVKIVIARIVDGIHAVV